MQTKIKHSKFRNTGILFELLIRQVTSDLMSSKDSKAITVLKKYFTNTEIAKELALYNSFLKASNLSESKADLLITTICEQSAKLNRVQLEREKYNLIKEIKKHYDLNNFFKAKIKDYKVSAAIYTVLEAASIKGISNTEQLVNSKITLLEFITENPVSKLEVDSSIADFLQEEKEVKILSYKFLVERFNQKYNTLSTEQKEVLKEYINNVSDTPQFRTFYNTKLQEVKTTLTKLSTKIDNKVTAIKLNEVIKNIQPITVRQSVKDDHLVSLMQYLELAKEIKNTVGK